MGNNIQYYVEGENEKTLVDVLKSEMRLVYPGKTEVLNVLTQRIRETRLRTLNYDTIVALIFDTDVASINLKILNENLNALKRSKRVQAVIIITQVENIEDELIRSTNIGTIKELLPTQTDRDFKRKFNRMAHKNIARKLQEHKFQIKILWTQQPRGIYQGISNEAEKIKIMT